MSRRRFGLKSSLTSLGVAALFVSVAALAVFGLQRVSPESASTAAASLPRESLANPARKIEQSPTLLVVGDTFVAGTGDPNITTYPQLVADRLGWNLRIDAIRGSGFTATVQDNDVIEPFIDRLPDDFSRYSVDVLLIDGGRNDLGKPPWEVIPAIDKYLNSAREYWPNATIIIVKPQFVTNRVAENYPILSNAIDEAAAHVDAKVIDPVAEGWYSGSNLDLLLIYDHVHLNGAGNQFYADRIADDLQRFGLGGKSAQAQGGHQ